MVQFPAYLLMLDHRASDPRLMDINIGNRKAKNHTIQANNDPVLRMQCLKKKTIKKNITDSL